jgi:FdrA protein
VVERVIVLDGVYRDSVALMSASQDASRLDGVDIATAVTATPMNLELLRADGFPTGEVDGATSADLVIAVRAEADQPADTAVGAIRAALRGGGADSGAARASPPRSLTEAARRRGDANLAVISVPGTDAAYECATALEAGLNVFCFSSGFEAATEAALKRRALELGLLMMGPDCGTAILGGTAIGFANQVERGPVGIVAASGTGAQQVSCLLDWAGVGISELIGLGGRDLSAEVGGLMAAHAISMLGADPRTECIVLIGKSPDPRVAAELARLAAGTGKSAILALPGAGPAEVPAGAEIVDTLEAAAVRAAEAAGSRVPAGGAAVEPPARDGAIRGLFCGGTLRDEALRIASDALPDDRTPQAVDDLGGNLGEGDAFIDFGSESMVQGRPHPMIDPQPRDDALIRHAMDPAVGAILVDVVLGRCAHPDPAASLGAAIERASGGPGSEAPAVVVSLCGAEGDPQGLARQADRLREAGAIVARSNAEATRIALGAVGAGERR